MKLMTKTADGRALELEPVFEISNGLMMRGDDDQFTGRISVGVLNRQDPASQLTLGEPVRFSVNGPVDEISPHDLSIDHTNLPLVVANLRARSPVAPVKLGVLVSFDPVVHDVEVPIVRPSLRLIPAQQQVWGFGLQTVQLNIQAEGLPQPAGRPVALTTSRGGFEPAMTVALDEEGTASAVLRSSGLGTASVKASSIGIPEATASVVFVFPWGFLMAVVVGAIVGTGAKAIPEGGSLRKWIAGLIGGLCGGTLAAVAWTVGVKLAEAQPAALWGEAAIFVVAGVAAYGGLQLGGGGRPPRDG